MDNMDNFRERFEALERRTQMVEQRLRWWRGIACGALLLGVLALTLPSGKAVDAQPGGLPERVEALEDKLAAVTFDAATHELVITEANLRIVNGLGSTETTNGLGNLIVGYNESRPPEDKTIRTGSHNVVVGRENNFSRFGGLVVGLTNEISGDFTSVSGGLNNIASGLAASVSGGQQNTASGDFAWASGGSINIASGQNSSVSGGSENIASGAWSSVSGGTLNTPSGQNSSVSGGSLNTASGPFSWVGGGLRNVASGFEAAVSGGESNTASGFRSSVSGGLNRTAPGDDDWAAGPLFADE